MQLLFYGYLQECWLIESCLLHPRLFQAHNMQYKVCSSCYRLNCPCQKLWINEKHVSIFFLVSPDSRAHPVFAPYVVNLFICKIVVYNSYAIINPFPRVINNYAHLPALIVYWRIRVWYAHNPISNDIRVYLLAYFKAPFLCGLVVFG